MEAKTFSVLVGISLLVLSVSVSNQARASGLKTGSDPCGTGSVQGFTSLSFSVCTAQSTYKIGDTVVIVLTVANTGSSAVTNTFGFDSEVRTTHLNRPTNFIAFVSHNFTGCLNIPCTVPAGGTLSESASWIADTKNSLTGVTPGDWIVDGGLSTCTGSTSGVSCTGIASATITITIISKGT